MRTQSVSQVSSIAHDSELREKSDSEIVNTKTIEPHSLDKVDTGHHGKYVEDIESKMIDGSADFPDGGFRAWLVVLGCFLGGFATFGFVNSWGVFQSYYEQTLLKGTNPSAIAWIGSIQYSLVFFPGLLTGTLFDLGHFHVPYSISSVFLIVCILLTAECQVYWHFLICQGFAVGLSCGMIFGPTMAILGHWFYHKRGIALGVTALGSSAGGTVFPILLRNLIPIIGFKWAIRVIGLVIFASLVVSNLTLKRRLPPKKLTGGLLNLKAFKDPVFTVYCLAQFVSFLGLYTVLTYIDSSATSVGIPSDFSFYLVAIVNAGSALGRISGGLVVNRIGCINLIAPISVMTAALTYAWPYAKSRNALIGIAIPYGFSAGVTVSTFILPLFHMGEVEDLGRRTGMAFFFAAFGALAGPPISGAINHSTGGYEASGLYAGSMCMFTVVLLLITRHLVLGKLWGKF